MSEMWERRWLDAAKLAASWSKDPSTKVGCVIVSPDNVRMSEGWNGFPRKVSDSAVRLDDRTWKIERVVHAEENAICNAARTGSAIGGGTAYVHGMCVCHRCAVSLIQSGVVRVVNQYPDDKKASWAEAHEKARELFEEVGIELVTYLERGEGK